MMIEKIELFNTDRVTAFSTFRSAETPELNYDGFSICHYTGDSPAHFNACRNALSNELGISKDCLVIPRQTHSSHIAIIDRIPVEDTACLEETDALVTCLHKVALCINTADCVPIVMTDERTGIIAAVHSGWRGTVSGIAAKTVGKMIALGASIDNIKVAMGPSICPGCFEVGNEVAEIFEKEFPGSGCVNRDLNKPHIDLSAAIRHQLGKAGIHRENISQPPLCSHCNPDTLFSARKQGIDSGRTATVIMLR